MPAPIDLFQLLHPQPQPGTGQGYEGTFELEVPDGLQQGRGAWGGVATGLMVAAAEFVGGVAGDGGLGLRSISAQLVAPLLVGPASVQVAPIRVGSATAVISATVRGANADPVASGVVVLGKPRAGAGMPDGPGWRALEPPDALARPAAEAPVVQIGPPLAPEFTRHLEFRPILGLPYSGSQSLTTFGWVRPLAPVPEVDAALITALADAWWVAVMARMPVPRPAATVTFSLDLTSDPEVVRRESGGRMEPLLHRGRVVAARSGYVSESRELWTSRGELVSWNTQNVAVIA